MVSLYHFTHQTVMAKYNFDICPDRRRSDAAKYCMLKPNYGRDDLLSMWIADMDFEVAPEIVEVLRSRVEHPVYGYAAVPDDMFPSIIDWLRSRHGFEVSPGEITFVAGVVRALGYIVNRFTSEGDGVVIQSPVYHPFRNVTVGNRRRCLDNPLRQMPDGTYQMDIDGLERLVVRERPRMMILCNPHNPIGLQWSAETLRAVARIAAENNMIVVSDEIHGDLMLGGRRHIPFLSVSDDARHVGIMLGAPSKTFNIPGLVSSWIVVKDAELRGRLFPWMEVNEFSSPTFFAAEATIVAYRQCEGWLDEALRYIEGNIDYVAEHLPAMTAGRVRVIKPEASFLVWLDCRDLNMTHDSLVDFMVNKAHLAMNDGEMFGHEGAGFMRMNVAAPRDVVVDAVDSLARAVNCLSN